MSAESNRARAIAVIESSVTEGIVRDAFTDDAVWWMQGARALSIDAFMEMHRAFRAMHVAGDGRMEIHGVTAEGDRVAVEAECFVPLKDGQTYSSTYHFLVCFRGERVCLVKEYFDTARARDAFRPSN